MATTPDNMLDAKDLGVNDRLSLGLYNYASKNIKYTVTHDAKIYA